MLDLLEETPDTELTLTHFDDSRATDESVLKEAAKSRNLSYQGWQGFLEQKLIDKKEEKQTVRIVTGSVVFLEPSESLSDGEEKRKWIHKRLKQL